MLARWFDRSGIGQLVAPDEKIAQEPILPEGAAPFWQFVAPDPIYEQLVQSHIKTPPAEAFRNEVQFLGVGPATPVNYGRDDYAIRTPSDSASFQRLPSSELDGLVLLAAKDTAYSMTSPVDTKGSRDKMFRLCGSSKPLNEQLQKRLRKQFENTPSLLQARATLMGQHVPDGYTPLMAAAHADHVVAAEIILEMAPSPEAVLNERDLQGRTALHIAAELGNLSVVNFLRQRAPVGSPPPVDLVGRTPLGRAVTSPNPNAKKHQRELEEALFSPGDVSVYGNPLPGFVRTGIASALEVAYGIADMPGIRVEMEDAICASMWKRERKAYCLLGVCDGHGDSGQVSKYIAEYAPSVLQSNMLHGQEDWNSIWTQTCLTLDARLREKELKGGSTAVLALITSDSVIVANVGDSRCILIQSRRSSVDDVSDKMESMTISKGSDNAPDKGYPSTIDGDQPELAMPSKATSPSEGPFVQALSEDHKPELEQERARIEKAGMKVTAVTFEDSGKECTIHKVERSATDKLAVARAFGDFEYKQNTSLGPEEQAVVAVPDVRIHTRDPDVDSYLVLACDGIWDVMSNEEVAEFVVTQMEERVGMSDMALPEVGDALTSKCYDLGSRDNMSVVIVAMSQTMGTLTLRSTAAEGKTLDFSSPRKR